MRILTHKDTGVPRGCAFIEWSNSKQHMVRRMDLFAKGFFLFSWFPSPDFSRQSALLYHQTMFKGRKINVELSAGGGGNVRLLFLLLLCCRRIH